MNFVILVHNDTNQVPGFQSLWLVNRLLVASYNKGKRGNNLLIQPLERKQICSCRSELLQLVYMWSQKRGCSRHIHLCVK